VKRLLLCLVLTSQVFANNDKHRSQTLDSYRSACGMIIRSMFLDNKQLLITSSALGFLTGRSDDYGVIKVTFNSPTEKRIAKGILKDHRTLVMYDSPNDGKDLEVIIDGYFGDIINTVSYLRTGIRAINYLKGE